MIVKVNDSADLNLSQKEFERVGSQARDCWKVGREGLSAQLFLLILILRRYQSASVI